MGQCQMVEHILETNTIWIFCSLNAGHFEWYIYLWQVQQGIITSTETHWHWHLGSSVIIVAVRKWRVHNIMSATVIKYHSIYNTAW